MQLQEDRYTAQAEVFGPAVQGKLRSLRVFLVGAGALGCEFLKNFAMMGLSTSAEGRVRPVLSASLGRGWQGW